MRISNDATESFDPEDQRKVATGLPAGTKLEGRAQGIAMPFGRGRVAVFGEAAMFSAQTRKTGDSARNHLFSRWKKR